jgi:hypothetical protein
MPAMHFCSHYDCANTPGYSGRYDRDFRRLRLLSNLECFSLYVRIRGEAQVKERILIRTFTACQSPPCQCRRPTRPLGAPSPTTTASLPQRLLSPQATAACYFSCPHWQCFDVAATPAYATLPPRHLLHVTSGYIRHANATFPPSFLI